MIETGFGRVLAVTQRGLGSALDGDHAAAATTLLVEDCADFDDTYGGQLVIDGVTYTYTAVDDEASTITLATGLADAVLDGTKVLLLDPLTLTTSTEWVAQVTVDGTDPGDSLEATVRSSLVDRLPDGLRGITGEAVELLWDEAGELWVVDILGQSEGEYGSGVIRFHVDTATAAGSGNLDVPLTYLPIDEYTPQVFWEPVHLGRDEWTRVGQLVTVTDPGFVADDEVSVHYAYHLGSNRPPVVADPPTFAAEVMADNPVLWAQLGESSGTAAADSSGNGRTGAYGGTVSLGQPSLAVGLPGTAVDLGGAGWIDWTPGAAWQRPPEFTAEIWCQPTTADGAYVFACDNAGTPGPNRIWSIQPASGARIWHDTSEEIASLGGWTAGAVMMVTLTFDGTTVSAYKNGELIDTEVASLGVMNTSTLHPLCIGAAGASNGDRLLKFDGLVQHALLYDTCLPGHRIAAHYAAGVGA